MLNVWSDEFLIVRPSLNYLFVVYIITLVISESLVIFTRIKHLSRPINLKEITIVFSAWMTGQRGTGTNIPNARGQDQIGRPGKKNRLREHLAHARINVCYEYGWSFVCKLCLSLISNYSKTHHLDRWHDTILMRRLKSTKLLLNETLNQFTL